MQPWLRVIGGISYVDAELTDFGGAGSDATAVLARGLITGGLQVDASGNQPRYIPALTGNFSLDFNFDNVLGRPVYARADAIYTGDFYVDNFEYNQVDAHWKLNLRGGVEVTDKIRAEVFVTNVTDDRSWITSGGTTSGAPGSRTTFSNAPPTREVGLRVIANF